jgi:glyoxylase-like metal-dependent hydrolase (beta-lactamase superfamily II)
MSLMPAIRFDIISIGTLSRNRLWNETQDLRTAHSTTTLIRSGNRNILVDPGLPAPALAARLHERTGLSPDRIDTVFLTNFRPDHRAGLSIFTRAKTFIHELEQQAVSQHLQRLLEQAPLEDIDTSQIKNELDLLESLRPAPDELADNLDLFPLFGYTPGTCGLLISMPISTVMVASDAVPTQDHFLAGQVLPESWDIKAAQESLREVYEIADLIVPGHDNIFQNPRASGM